MQVAAAAKLARQQQKEEEAKLEEEERQAKECMHRRWGALWGARCFGGFWEKWECVAPHGNTSNLLMVWDKGGQRARAPEMIAQAPIFLRAGLGEQEAG